MSLSGLGVVGSALLEAPRCPEKHLSATGEVSPTRRKKSQEAAAEEVEEAAAD